jgi:hypothetical protein
LTLKKGIEMSTIQKYSPFKFMRVSITNTDIKFVFNESELRNKIKCLSDSDDGLDWDFDYVVFDKYIKMLLTINYPKVEQTYSYQPTNKL